MIEKTVGLLWHSVDSANLGVEALTVSQIGLVSRACALADVKPSFSIIGWTRDGAPLSDPRIGRLTQVNFRRFMGRDPALFRAIKACDIVFDIGEGDSFSDIYGAKRLTYLMGTKAMVLRHGIPLILSPQTLGPFNGSLAARFADMLMARSRLVCSRDKLSSDYYRSRGLRAPFHEAIDVAFALPFVSQVKAGDGRIRVGVNVSGLMWAGGYSGKNQFGLRCDYRAAVLALLDHFSRLPEVDVVLVPHVIPESRREEDDHHAAMEIARAYPATSVAPRFDSAGDAKGFISGLDFFTGARMHACIAAFSSGVPVVPMAYSRKFIGLFGTLGYDEVADCTKDSTEAVVGRITRAFEIRESLAQRIAAANAMAAERLDRYVSKVAECLKELV